MVFSISSIFAQKLCHLVEPLMHYKLKVTEPAISRALCKSSLLPTRQGHREEEEEGLTDVRNSIQRHNESSLFLASRIALTQAREVNLVFSPLTLGGALSMVAAGSKGKTAEQILRFLRAQTIEELNTLSAHVASLILNDGSGLGGPALSSASGVWVDESTPLKPAFAEIMKKIYGAECKNVDFQTKATEVKDEVNAWTENQTNGLIKELLPPRSVDSSTRLILANALYFKGAWQEKFDASLTTEGYFHPLRGESLRVPFMTSEKKQFVAAFPGFQVLRLPYARGEDKRQLSMSFFLPRERNGLHNLVKSVGSDKHFINRHVPTKKVGVGRFMIPKFKISYGFEASELLKQMGLLWPFSRKAELTEMIDSPLGTELYVKNIFQKSVLEVSEEGTEAASATAMNMSLSATDFVADHPFMFLIREELTGALLFVGHVLNPLLAA